MTNLERWLLYMRDIESPLEYIKWGFYSMIASALQRRVWLYPADDGSPCGFSLFPNIFVLLIGPPATGKGRVIKQVSSILSHTKLCKVTDSGKLKPLIQQSPDKVTCERLIRSISEGTTTCEYLVGEEKKVSAFSSCFFLIEELEVLFNSNASDMVSVLNQCYDAGNLSYETVSQGCYNIRNICVSMLAGTTPESLKNLMSDKIVKTGFTSRVIPIYKAKQRFYRVFPGISKEQMEAADALAEHLKVLATKVSGPVKFSNEAEEYFKSIYESGKMPRIVANPKTDYYYARKRVHWLKLAMILHFADDTSNEIGLQETKKALEELNEIEKEMGNAVAPPKNPLHDATMDILEFVSKERGEVKLKTLWFKFSEFLRREEFDECLRTLVSTDRISVEAGVVRLKSASPYK